MSEMTTQPETVPCPTCGGTGKVYQTEAQLGGDRVDQETKDKWKLNYTTSCTCNTCNGSGQVPK